MRTRTNNISKCKQYKKKQKGGTNDDELIKAIINGNKETVENLLEKGANVNAKDNREGSALIWASKRGHKEIVEMLLEKGANVNATDNDGETALSMASYYKHT